MPTPPRATTLDDAYRTCNHDKPLQPDDERYEDLSAARGDDTAKRLKQRLMRAEPDEFVHVAFVSHRGAGKTTEILRVCDHLKHSHFSYYFESNTRLDDRHITAEDLLLSLALGVQDCFEANDLPLPDKLVAEVQGWFSEIVKSTEWGTQLSADLKSSAGAGGEIPFFAKLKVELQGLLRAESKYRRQVQEAFRRYPGTLIRYVNNLLDAANARLGDRQLLIVLDNLDRYDPQVVDDLLFKNGRPLRGLRCHLIVTPPIALYYRPMTEQLAQSYLPELMYTVRLRRQDQPYGAFDPQSPARGLLVEALDKRMDVAKLIPDTAAVDRLVSASGGAIRDLLRLVRESILLVGGATLDLATINRAATRLRIDMRDRINANGWAPTLARVMRDHQVNDETDCMDLLYQQLVFRYNGSGWYDVHPLVAEIPEVLDARTRLAAEQVQPPPTVAG